MILHVHHRVSSAFLFLFSILTTASPLRINMFSFRTGFRSLARNYRFGGAVTVGIQPARACTTGFLNIGTSLLLSLFPCVARLILNLDPRIFSRRTRFCLSSRLPQPQLTTADCVDSGLKESSGPPFPFFFPFPRGCTLLLISSTVAKN